MEPMPLPDPPARRGSGNLVLFTTMGALLGALVIVTVIVGIQAADLAADRDDLEHRLEVARDDLSRQQALREEAETAAEEARDRAESAVEAAEQLRNSAIDRRAELDGTQAELLATTQSRDASRAALQDPWALPPADAAFLLPAGHPLWVDLRVKILGSSPPKAGSIDVDEERVDAVAEDVLRSRGLPNRAPADREAPITIRLAVKVVPRSANVCESTVVAEIRRPVADSSGTRSIDVIVERVEKISRLGDDPGEDPEEVLRQDIDRVLEWCEGRQATGTPSGETTEAGDGSGG